MSWAHEYHNLTQISKDKGDMSLALSLSQQHVITLQASYWPVDITSEFWLADTTQPSITDIKSMKVTQYIDRLILQVSIIDFSDSQLSGIQIGQFPWSRFVIV